MPNYGMPTRGCSRLTAWGSLPRMDAHADIRYEGSISKCGDNADWDWGLYPDENGEWVLMEADGPGYTTDGRRETGENRFENGIHEQYHAYTCVRDMHRSQFTVPIPADNRGVVLKRVSLQDRGRQCATVYVNGQRVTERQWLFADSNPIYSLLEDSFTVPAHYTAGQEQLTVT